MARTGFAGKIRARYDLAAPAYHSGVADAGDRDRAGAPRLGQRRDLIGSEAGGARHALVLARPHPKSPIVLRSRATGESHLGNLSLERTRMRVLVKRILRKYGYPPDLQDAAVRTVLQQAEVLSASWAA